MIDLRSDTITKPTAGMLKAMQTVEVGDDVFAEDPHANAFQQKVAAMFGMEAGLFVPSGTMGNQLALKVLTESGDEILIDEKGHIFNYETGASAFLSGIQIHAIKGEKGKLQVKDLQHKTRGTYDWEPVTKVICLENTTNKGGGVCYTREELKSIKKFADEEGLNIHLDGARIWNAITTTGIEPDFFGTIADTVSVCFSKGLGAPVGSMLLSSKDRIAKARRFRKMWGGGMRQIGLLTAAAEYALDHHLPLLKEDHRRAKEFANTVSQCSKLAINLDAVESNIVLFDVLEGDVPSVLATLEGHGIRMVQFGPQTIRVTFHFQIGNDALMFINEKFKLLFN